MKQGAALLCRGSAVVFVDSVYMHTWKTETELAYLVHCIEDILNVNRLYYTLSTSF